MSESAKAVQISGNQLEHGYIAARDLYLGDQYVAQETLFFEPDLKDVEPPAWETTSKARELARALAAHHLVILGGQDVDDKTRIARHLAWLLRQELPGKVQVREWYRSSDPQKLETSLHEEDVTILLLPQILPHHIGHRLTELTRLLQRRRHYAVITTDGSRAEWGIRRGSSEETFWQELLWETWYGRPFLAETLLTELASLNGQRPAWLPRELHPGSELSEHLTLEDIAVRLKQPERIRRFAEWITTDEASPRSLPAQLDQIGGDRAAIFQWYRQLDRSDQLLALGLVLFDGLPDDQIFAAIELLVTEAWRQSDPNLPLFDYKDLQRLSAYFHLAESGEDGTRIETSSRLKREAILQAAWEFQRRRLLVVVPTITRLLHELSSRGGASSTDTAEGQEASPKSGKEESAPKENAELWRFTRGAQRELFSSSRRVEQLHRSIIEALSQVGVLSFEAVEASFLELAASGSVESQTVVAKALAAWRGEDHSGQLFRVLKAWWTDGCLAAPSKPWTAKIGGAGDDPLAAMRATVALTVGYALQYDRPNQLAPELLELLRMLLRDRHPAVQERMLELTLPLATASHLCQLEPLLRQQITLGQEHIYAIAFGTAMAFSLRPAESIEIIERWHAFCRSQGKDQSDLAVTPRDRLLAVVAMAYGYIECDQAYDLLTPDQIISCLHSILAAETNPFVRTHALMAMGLQAMRHFELVSSTLVELISEITLADRLHVVTVLARAYLHQREQLKGGDEEIEIDGHTFQVWIHSQRPLTGLENALYSWLQDEHHPVAQQVAIQTFAAIAATELECRERALPFRLDPAPDIPPPNIVRLPPDPPRLHTAGLLGQMAVALATPRRRGIRPLLNPIMAEVIEVRRLEPTRFFESMTARSGQIGRKFLPGQAAPSPSPLLPTLFSRWQATGEEGMQSVVRSLGIALDLFRWRWPIVLTLAVSCVLLVHDVREWKWALGNSIPVEQQRTIQQRGSATMRLAWGMILSDKPPIELQPPTEDPESPPPPLAPATRFALSAQRALQQFPEHELLAGAFQIRDTLAELQQASMMVGEPSSEGSFAIEEPAPSPRARNEEELAPSPQDEAVVTPEESSPWTEIHIGPSEESAEDTPDEPLDQRPRRREELAPSEPEQSGEPDAKPGFWKRFRDRRLKQRPPQGEDHGRP